MHRVFDMPFSSVYPHYVAKVERKGRSFDELLEVIHWLTGYSRQEILDHSSSTTTLGEFFDGANINRGALKITGVICGVRVEDIEDPLMQKIRYLDKLVDELARGKVLDKVLRKDQKVSP